MNTAQAVTENPMTAVKARTLASVYTVPLGGAALPAMEAVIHRKVEPNRNRPIARMLRKVHITSLLSSWSFTRPRSAGR